MVKNPPAKAGDTSDVVGSLGWEDPLEEDMATHSSILSRIENKSLIVFLDAAVAVAAAAAAAAAKSL